MTIKVAVICGERSVLEHVYDRYADRLYRLSIGFGLTSRQAEEVLKDVFGHVWHRMAEFHPEEGSFSDWILNVWKDNMLAELRRIRNQPAVPAESLYAAAVSSSPASSSRHWSAG